MKFDYYMWSNDNVLNYPILPLFDFEYGPALINYEVKENYTSLIYWHCISITLFRIRFTFTFERKT